jgi:hypothetical protein
MNEVACDWFENNNALILTSELIYKQMWSHIYDSPALCKLGVIFFRKYLILRVSQSFPRYVGHAAMSSKNWVSPVKGYSLLDQMTSRNLSTSSVEYVNVL